MGATWKRCRQKVLAALAAGLTLGVGAVATLAVWTDHEFATGSFSTGEFNLVGNPEGADEIYNDHDTAGEAATVNFTMPQAKNLAPGDVVYGAYWVQLDNVTTSPAELDIKVAANGALSLPWTLHAIDPGEVCDETVTGPVNYSGQNFGQSTAGPGGTIPLAAGTDGAAGAPVQLCFTVTAPNTIQQGQTGAATWDITATSVEN